MNAPAGNRDAVDDGVGGGEAAARQHRAVPPQRLLDRGAGTSERSPRTASSCSGLREQTGEQHVVVRKVVSPPALISWRRNEIATSSGSGSPSTSVVASTLTTSAPGVGAPLVEHGGEVAAELRRRVERVRHVGVRDDLRDRQLVEGVDVVAGQAEHPVDHVERVRARRTARPAPPVPVSRNAPTSSSTTGATMSAPHSCTIVGRNACWRMRR